MLQSETLFQRNEKAIGLGLLLGLLLNLVFHSSQILDYILAPLDCVLLNSV